MKNTIFHHITHDEHFKKFNWIQRWANCPTHTKETIPHHSYWVTVFSATFAEVIFPHSVEDKYNILMLSLFHEADEVLTGDIEHGLKYGEGGEEMKEALEKIIEIRRNSFFQKDDVGVGMKLFDYWGIGYEDDDSLHLKDFYKKVIKLADWCSFVQYAQFEINMGNIHLVDTKDYCKKYIFTKIDEIIKECGTKAVNEYFAILKTEIEKI